MSGLGINMSFNVLFKEKKGPTCQTSSQSELSPVMQRLTVVLVDGLPGNERLGLKDIHRSLGPYLC